MVMTGYRILADLILLIHLLFAGFMVIGLFLIITGLVLRWRWVRNFWFRAFHLGTSFFILVQSCWGAICPLTTWENALRLRAGGATYPGGFIAYWLERSLYYEAAPWVFTLSYALFGSAVLVTFLVGRPRIPWAGPNGGP
jgi:hypothetical protein